VALALPCTPFVLITLDVYNSRTERHRLLHETDHKALLAASRKMMQEVADETIFDPAQDPRVPPIIRKLGPSHITISPRQLTVELHGGFDHYGFIAFLHDESDLGSGRKKLIDGLFYYEE